MAGDPGELLKIGIRPREFGSLRRKSFFGLATVGDLFHQRDGTESFAVIVTDRGTADPNPNHLTGLSDQAPLTRDLVVGSIEQTRMSVLGRRPVIRVS